jgi:hypothetical protein
MVLDALANGRSEVRLWGVPPDVDDAKYSVPHRLSRAARAFKAQAMAAAADPLDASEVTEIFRRGDMSRLPAGAAWRSGVQA